MAHVADHLSVSALEQQYRSCTDVTAARHLQTLWLLAKGHEMAEVAATVNRAGFLGGVLAWITRLGQAPPSDRNSAPRLRPAVRFRWARAAGGG